MLYFNHHIKETFQINEQNQNTEGILFKVIVHPKWKIQHLYIDPNNYTVPLTF